MQQITEQSNNPILMYTGDSFSSEAEQNNSRSLDHFKFNRYSSASLDSGRGSDLMKV